MASSAVSMFESVSSISISHVLSGVKGSVISEEYFAINASVLMMILESSTTESITSTAVVSVGFVVSGFPPHAIRKDEVETENKNE